MSKTTNKTTETKKPEIKTITVAAIAREELEIDPKVARAKMRRIYKAEDAPASLPKPLKEGGWTFDAKDHDAVVALLTQ